MKRKRLCIAAAALAAVVALPGQYIVPVSATEQQGESAALQKQTAETKERDALAELIENGSFESGALTEHWTKSSWCTGGDATMEIVSGGEAGQAPDGDKYLKEASGSGGSQVTQEVDTEAGEEYWLSAKIWQDAANEYTIGVQTNEGKGSDGQAHTQATEVAGEWTGVAVRFTMWEEKDTDKTYAYTWLQNNSTAYLDDISLTEAPDYSGLQAAADEAETKLDKKPGGGAAEQWAELEEKYQEAEELLDVYSYESSQLSQEEINTKAAALKEAAEAVGDEGDSGDGDVTEQENYLTNGDFSQGDNGLQGWNKWPSGTNAVVSGDGEDRHVTLTYQNLENAGGVGINQNITNLEKGNWYKLSGKVRADKVCALGLEVKADNDNNKKVSVVNSRAVTDGEWEEVSLLFQAQSSSSNNVAIWLTEGKADVKDVAITDARAPQSTGETYYIDAENGNDSNDGKSEETAWKSFSNLQDIRLTEGGGTPQSRLYMEQ